MSNRTLTFGALALTAVAAGLLVSGCSGTPTAGPTTTVTTTVTPSPSSPTSPSPTPTATHSATPTSSPTSTAGGQTDPDAPAGQCADSALAVSVTPAAGGAAAGSVYLDVVFTNTGGTSCELRGDPGVSVVGGGNGTQLGSPATQSGSDAVATLTLASGSSVSAQLKQVDIGTDGGALAGRCTVQPADGYRVYPPHSFTAFFVAASGLIACGNAVDWMTVGPVTAG